MKTVLCDKDNFRKYLCPECMKKLQAQKFSETDALVSQTLGKLSKVFPIMDVTFHRSIDVENFLILACSGKIGSIIGKDGKIAAELSKQLGKKVRIIEKTKNEKKMIQDMLGNARVIGIEKIFEPGNHRTKILVQKSDEKKLLGLKEQMEKGLEQLLETKTLIEFV